MQSKSELKRHVAQGVVSYKPEVIADSSGQWTGNALRFATEAGAQAYVKDLYSRWSLVSDTRVVPSTEPANYRWDSDLGRAVEIKEEHDVDAPVSF